MASSLATCPVHDSVAVSESEGERERERVTQILGREDLLGFCASPVVAARATPVRQAPSQVDLTKSAKKSAEKIRPDLLQMLGNKVVVHIFAAAHLYRWFFTHNSIAARGAEQEGRNQAQGSRGFWDPLGASELDPLFQQFGVSETPSQRPVRAPERLSGPRGRLFRGLGEVCPFSKERGKKVGHSEAPKRPRFAGCLLRGSNPRVPTLRPQINTVGTKIIADPEKCFQELISEKLRILLRDWADWPCLELNIISGNFQAFLFLQKITGVSLEAINSSKRVLRITALSRINSSIISARTVI